jgi:hypothetical protein
MGPRFMAKRRMGYSRNVISHASSLLADLVSCTVWGSSLRNKEAIFCFNLTHANKNFPQRQNIRRLFHILDMLYVTRYLSMKM